MKYDEIEKHKNSFTSIIDEKFIRFLKKNNKFIFVGFQIKYLFLFFFPFFSFSFDFLLEFSVATYGDTEKKFMSGLYVYTSQYKSTRLPTEKQKRNVCLRECVCVSACKCARALSYV